MSKRKPLYFSNEVILYPLFFVMLLWIAFWIEVRFGFSFKRYGIFPERIEGLRGVLLGPFIHGDLKHLFNNSIPMFVLSSTLFYFYRSVRWKVMLFGLLFTGILTWFLGRPALHIGASGVVYMLAAFLFFKGIFSRQFQLTALSLIVVFLYGGMLWYLFPIDPKISWEGHLSGFIVGIVLALVFRKNPVENKKYEWEREDFNPEDDPFLRQFDADGNFVEIEREVEVETDEQTPTKISIQYTYRDKSKDELE